MNWNRLGWVVAIEAAVIMVAASFFLHGGQDLHLYYQPFAQGCLDCGFVPYFARWLLWPLSWIPASLVWPIWSAVSLGSLLVLCRFTKVNPALVLLSFPAIGQFWLGQIDVIVCVGLALALLGRNPFLRGLGILLALTKPQIAGLAILVLLVSEHRRDLLRVLVIPVGALALSLAVFGLDWPLQWLRNASSALPPHVWRLAAGDLWPYAAVLLPAPFFFRGREKRLQAALLVSALASPFLGVYSYLVFLVFMAPGWAVPLSYVWVLAYPLWGASAMRLAWVLPACMLVALAVRSVRERRHSAVGPKECPGASENEHPGTDGPDGADSSGRPYSQRM